MDFLSAGIQRYVETTTTPESDLLRQIHRDTHLNVLKPRMLSGHLQGRVLSMLSHMIRPKRVLEIGTYTGYATLCLAEGLDKDGKIYTIDINEELKSRVEKYFDMSGYNKQIEFLIGNAVDLIPSLKEKWDLVFVDADKENYLRYYDLVLPQMQQGGFLIADNVLWSGKVVDSEATDETTEVLREFNQQVTDDSRVENVLLPIRDGLMIVRKK